ncbi:hypothetical protein B7494_g2389 [Chlorociboria aeruginascens]|nr:hypothetical protein B7494_g2389 [Chlorociboria aeruginascens]
MNNSQFRKLVLDTPVRQSGTGERRGAAGATPRGDGAPSTLGSRMRSSIPMTPRSIAGGGGVDFARQLAERNAEREGKPLKKFRSAAAPKGAKLPSGYVDRTQNRISEDEDDKAARVKSLEEMMKLQQIDEATFINLRDEILGGDVESTHLVKGLDYKLLERVRRGEDVLNGNEKEDEGEGENLDDEFEKLEDREVVAVERKVITKKGDMAPPSLVPGKKRNRDQILAEMKAAREVAKQDAQPSLGSKFKKVGASRATSRIEKDRQGREVLITVDEDGNEKRKVRKIQLELKAEKDNGILVPDKNAKPLGMDVSAIPIPPEEDEDVDIFDDAGDDYNPLAGLGEDDSDAEEGEEGEINTRKEKVEVKENVASELGSMAPPPKPKGVSRNYFGDTKTDASESTTLKAFTDPTILAALKKASTLNPIARGAENKEEAAKEARRKKMLQQDDRDAQDMDMGFGSSRFADEEDFEEKKVKLSEWGGKGDDGEEGGKTEGKTKRKRGPKKRKGDVNSAADVLKDAFAILFSAYHPNINLLGISTVHGNSSLSHTTYNALSLLTSMSATHIPVHAGASRPLNRHVVHADSVHGTSGLDGTSLLPTPSFLAGEKHAIDAIATALLATPPGSAWLIATGALTNVALLFQQYPELRNHVKGVSIMGGAIGDFTAAKMGKVDELERIGNWSVWAEFNILVDPEAASFIFKDEILRLKIVMVPLDVTHLVLATSEVQKLLLDGKKGQGEGRTTLRIMLVELLTFFAGAYKDVFGIEEGPPLHDPLAVAVVLDGVVGAEIPFYDEKRGRRERYQVDVVTEGSHEDAKKGAQTGRTIVKLLPEGEEGVKIPRGLDVGRFWDVLEDCLQRADEANKANKANEVV